MATSARLGFNGELHEPGTRWQLLGNGYRAYNPVLMRFHGADNLSPFGKGGTHSYGYCGGDPKNKVDPSGSSVGSDRGSLRSLSGYSVASEWSMAGRPPAGLQGPNPVNGRFGRRVSSVDSGLGSVSGGSTRRLGRIGSISSFRSESSGSSIGLGQGALIDRDGEAWLSMMARGEKLPGGVMVAGWFDAEKRWIRAY